ncbi:YceI family protein [Crenobacter sp. SG2303]|uniref:YceI family protein n=1 Tax=Crenobacter oryzisoli TaxID=3056844 RepID=A0ABT7XPW0_9NEIS|nr:MULTISPECIES: YceI family protein [unclassified Crenobacter]MDN0075816.1 YceI family protein [Crenobacter sp. SG2303]MDN0082666.1 YceI family protein [Crenobacter sp. SG2305]
MRLITALTLATLPVLALAQPIDAAKSQIGFTMKQLNVPVDGRFKAFNANIDFDPAKAAAGRADITIQTGSIALPTRDAEGEAKKKEWFNTTQFPTARFVTSSIKPLGGDRYQFSGKLTIKGTTRDVSAPFTAKSTGGQTLVEGVLPISRTAYKIGEGEWADDGTVADAVQIKFKVALNGK